MRIFIKQLSMAAMLCIAGGCAAHDDSSLKAQSTLVIDAASLFLQFDLAHLAPEKQASILKYDQDLRKMSVSAYFEMMMKKAQLRDVSFEGHVLHDQKGALLKMMPLFKKMDAHFKNIGDMLGTAAKIPATPSKSEIRKSIIASFDASRPAGKATEQASRLALLGAEQCASICTQWRDCSGQSARSEMSRAVAQGNFGAMMLAGFAMGSADGGASASSALAGVTCHATFLGNMAIAQCGKDCPSRAIEWGSQQRADADRYCTDEVFAAHAGQAAFTVRGANNVPLECHREGADGIRVAVDASTQVNKFCPDEVYKYANSSGDINITGDGTRATCSREGNDGFRQYRMPR